MTSSSDISGAINGREVWTFLYFELTTLPYVESDNRTLFVLFMSIFPCPFYLLITTHPLIRMFSGKAAAHESRKPMGNEGERMVLTVEAPLSLHTCTHACTHTHTHTHIKWFYGGCRTYDYITLYVETRQNRVSGAWISNDTPHFSVGVITYPYDRQPVLAHSSTYIMSQQTKR